MDHSWVGTWWGAIVLELVSDAVWLALIGAVAIGGFWWVAHERQNKLNRFFGPNDEWDGKIRIRLSNVYVVPYGTRSFAGRDIGAFGPAATTGEFRAATEFEKEMYRPAQRGARLLSAIAGEFSTERGRNVARPVRCEIRPSPLYFDDHGGDEQVPGYQVVDHGIPYRDEDFQNTGTLAKKCLEQLRGGSLIVAGSDVYNMLSGFIQFREYQKTNDRIIWWKRIPRGDESELGKHGENMTERVLMIRKDCTLLHEAPEEHYGEPDYTVVMRRKTSPARGGQFEPFYIRKITNEDIVGESCVFLCEGTSTASTGAAMAMLALNWDRWEQVFGKEEFALVYDVEATKLEPNEPDDLIPENKPRLLAFWSEKVEVKGRDVHKLTDVRWRLRED